MTLPFEDTTLKAGRHWPNVIRLYDELDRGERRADPRHPEPDGRFHPGRSGTAPRRRRLATTAEIDEGDDGRRSKHLANADALTTSGSAPFWRWIMEPPVFATSVNRP